MRFPWADWALASLTAGILGRIVPAQIITLYQATGLHAPATTSCLSSWCDYCPTRARWSLRQPGMVDVGQSCYRHLARARLDHPAATAGRR